MVDDDDDDDDDADTPLMLLLLPLLPYMEVEGGMSDRLSEGCTASVSDTSPHW